MKLFVEKTKRHIQNCKDLVEKLEEIEIEEGEVITSFDVTALFFSVPGKEVIQMAVQRVKSDLTWKERTLMTCEEFGGLLKMVVEITYFRFQDKIYEQIFGMSMGSPFSPCLSNTFMERFEEKALDEASTSRYVWSPRKSIRSCLSISISNIPTSNSP